MWASITLIFVNKKNEVCKKGLVGSLGGNADAMETHTKLLCLWGMLPPCRGGKRFHPGSSLNRCAPTLSKLLLALQRSRIANPEDTEWLPGGTKGVHTFSRLLARNHTWALLYFPSYKEETSKSKNSRLTLEDNLPGRESVLSEFWRTTTATTNHGELFIRWVPPYIIKRKLRTDEIQSLGDDRLLGP